MSVRPSGFRRTRRLVAAAVARVEGLEPRRLMSADLDGDVLTVNGTGGDDDLRVGRDGKDLVVTLNGDEDARFKDKDVKEIRLNGLGGDDTIRVEANVGGATLSGGDGNDTLLGGENDDTLIGGDGNDTLDGKEGADVYAGGDGFDSADYRFETANLTLSIDGVANESGGNAGGDDIGVDVERVLGGSGNDRITGSAAANSITGREGDDTIFGGDGNDSIDGNEGDDQINGEGDDDVLTGGDGEDTMVGGAGNDSFVANDLTPDTLDGGAGSDTAVADQPGDTFSGIEAGVNIPEPEITVSQNGGGTLTDNFSTVDFGSVQQGQGGPTRTFTVKNDGDDVLSLGAVSVPTGFILTEGLDGPLQPGESDTFTIRVDTSAAGGLSGVVSFTNTDPDENPFNFTVTATVTTPPPQIPDITVRVGGNGIADGATSPIDFGTVDEGSAGPTRTFNVINDGNGALTIESLTLPAGFTLVQGLSGSIAPGNSDSFKVRMNTGTPGGRGGEIVITSNDPDEDPFNFAIAGQVNEVVPPAPDISVIVAGGPTLASGVSTVDFGKPVVGAAGPTRQFVIRNDGQAGLTLGAVTVPAGFTLVSGPEQSVLAVGQTATFTVRLNTASAGVRSGSVTIASNDPDEKPFTFGVTGTVGQVQHVPQPEITVGVLRKGKYRLVTDGVTALAFGSYASNVKPAKTARTFRIRNDGDATLNLGNLVVPDGFIVLDGLRSSLAPGKSDLIVIAVNTKGGVGAKSGNVSFSNNDANENPFSFAVSATVTAPPAAGRPEVVVTQSTGQAVTDGSTTAISFGSVRRSAKAPTRTFVVHNAGNATLTIGAMTVPKRFAVTEALASSIAPGKSDSFTIALSTKLAGNRGGRVSFVTNDANENPFDFAIGGAVMAPPVVGGGPAVTASLSGGVLTVNGSAGIDTIEFTSPSKGVIAVNGNGRAVAGSPFNKVTRIVVNGNGGDDRIDGSAVSVPLTMAGGLGNDTLIGGGGGDNLSGNDGNDALFGNGGIDVLQGNAGNDTITATDGVADNVVDGGPGTDSIRKDRVDKASGT